MTLSPAWPGCILKAGSSDKSLPVPNTTIRQPQPGVTGSNPRAHKHLKKILLTQRGFVMGWSPLPMCVVEWRLGVGGTLDRSCALLCRR
jgi:hypothetical protein